MYLCTVYDYANVAMFKQQLKVSLLHGSLKLEGFASFCQYFLSDDDKKYSIMSFCFTVLTLIPVLLSFLLQHLSSVNFLLFSHVTVC